MKINIPLSVDLEKFVVTGQNPNARNAPEKLLIAIMTLLLRGVALIKNLALDNERVRRQRSRETIRRAMLNLTLQLEESLLGKTLPHLS